MMGNNSIKEIVGWRVWSLSYSQNTLLSPLKRTVWTPNRPLEAKCYDRKRRHTAPGRQCRCGIWATRQAPTIIGGNVLGLVRLWGEIAVHGNEGWRGQFAQPIAIFYPSSYAIPCSELGLEITEQVAEIYGVPCVKLTNRHWAAAAKELGAPDVRWVEEQLKLARERMIHPW